MAKANLIAASQLLLAVLILLGVWVGLPARWLWIDLPLTALALACVAISVALLAGKAWAPRAVRVLLGCELAVGSLIVSLLALSIGQLAGSYGPVGAGGAVLMGTIAALIVPYLVVLPALLLAFARKLG
ncbi:MAG TPA: hypothetical protein VMF89_00970 [Polyangiales bacterium]|nr:hypothetical protein [Polyangiales bacterium]